MTEILSKTFLKPAAFGTEPLSASIDVAIHNIFATYCHKSEWYGKFLRVDEAFSTAFQNISETKDLFSITQELHTHILTASHLPFVLCEEISTGCAGARDWPIFAPFLASYSCRYPAHHTASVLSDSLRHRCVTAKFAFQSISGGRS